MDDLVHQEADHAFAEAINQAEQAGEGDHDDHSRHNDQPLRKESGEEDNKDHNDEDEAELHQREQEVAVDQHQQQEQEQEQQEEEEKAEVDAQVNGGTTNETRNETRNEAAAAADEAHAEEEDECRVCRGPTTDDQPLFHPCKCSGSIGLVHQDCLTSWLEVTRGDGRCEVCKTKFRFEPQYANNAPDQLPFYEVILGLCSRMMSKWLPFMLRIALAASMWLIVAPLITSYLYHIFMFRASSIPSRWTWALLAVDTVSGAVIVATIAISLISLMSFADFLRIHWQEPPRQARQQDDENDVGNAMGNGHDMHNINVNVDGNGNIDVDNLQQLRPHQQNGNRLNNINIDENEQRIDQAIVDHVRIIEQGLRQELDDAEQREGPHQQQNSREMGAGQSNDTDNGATVDDAAAGAASNGTTGHPTNPDRVGDSADDIPGDVALDDHVHDRNNNGNGVADGTDGDGEILDVDSNEDDELDEEELALNFEHFVLNELDDDDDDDDGVPGAGGDGMDRIDNILRNDQRQGAGNPLDAGARGNNLPPINVDQGPFGLNQPQHELGGFGDINDPLDPIFEDNQVDMEINVALDELLGLRGPINLLTRNLMWLLACNALSLFVFMFLPKSFGSIVNSYLLNTTVCTEVIHSIPYLHSDDKNVTTVISIITAVTDESTKLKTTLQLDDIAMVFLGYISLSAFIIWSSFLLYTLRTSTGVQNSPQGAVATGADGAAAAAAPAQEQEQQEEAVDNLVANAGDDQPAAEGQRQEQAQAQGQVQQPIGGARNEIPPIPDPQNMDRFLADRPEPLANGHGDADIDNVLPLNAEGFGAALDATTSIVKVGVLLFLKMFFMPTSLGLYLDVCTLSLFGDTVQDRTSFAARDLFSFAIVHWVAGITFMLLVTVFMLQLREVIHPDLLAKMIRPQEPHPDLLGNLMNERVMVHARRIFISLAIYVPLLTIQVALPIKVILASGVLEHTTFFRLNFWHLIMPQIQIPIELFIFHMSMLSLLERYKNSIGDLQHAWLKFLCRHLDLTEHLLPLSVQQFRFVGTKPIFIASVQTDNNDNSNSNSTEKGDVSENRLGEATQTPQVDPFWYELAGRHANMKRNAIESFVLSNVDSGRVHDANGNSNTNNNCTCSASPTEGETDDDGYRVLDKSTKYIMLPKRDTSETDESTGVLLPTSIGPYRLMRQQEQEQGEGEKSKTKAASHIEVWVEESGAEVARPPEGWDDLGIGGAFVQGRWGYGKERRSRVECGIAQRAVFRKDGEKYLPTEAVCRIALMCILSSMMIMVTVAAMLCCPLAVGRGVCRLFYIPRDYVHDPFAFCMGASIFYPAMQMLRRSGIVSVDGDGVSTRVKAWQSRFSVPPTSKLSTIIQTAFLWTFITPLALGVGYDMMFVKSARWYAGEGGRFSTRELALSWMSGLIMLHFGAFLMYFKVFTWGFWMRLGNGLFEAPGEEDRHQEEEAGPQNEQHQNQGANVADNGQQHGEDHRRWRNDGWQGKHGRASRFFDCCKSIFVDWEWDAVDPTIMLDEFAVPIAKHAMLGVLGSSSICLITLSLAGGILPYKAGMITVPLIGKIKLGLFRLVTLRASVALHVLIQLAMEFQESMGVWFQAAHKAARDDRYLVGEVLINYVAEERNGRT